MYEQVYYPMLSERLEQGNGFAFSASFNKRDIRELYYEMLAQKGVKDVYIVCHTATDEDISARLSQRALLKPDYVDKPTCVLSEFDAYKMMKKENDAFEPGEVALRKNYHVIMYDTSKQEITLYNKDDRLERIAFALRANAEQKFCAKAVVR